MPALAQAARSLPKQPGRRNPACISPTQLPKLYSLNFEKPDKIDLVCVARSRITVNVE